MGVCKSLTYIHDCGICHRDVRLSNILKFGNYYQLIDFGLSGPTGSEIVLTTGGRLDGVGYRLLGSRDGDKVTWDSADDYHMCVQTITALVKS